MPCAGAASLATDLKISPAKARVFVERFLAQFPAVSRWISDTKRQAHQYGLPRPVDSRVRPLPTLRVPRADLSSRHARGGYVRTLFGRRRLLPDIHSTSKEICAAAERQVPDAYIAFCVTLAFG